MSDSPAVFTVLDSGETVDVDGERLPTVVIDATGNPEITDLARVHSVEGIGDVRTEAALVPVGDDARRAGVESVLVLMIAITVPVRCTFAIALALPEHRVVIEQARAARRLVIATTPPERAEIDHPLWLAIDLDSDALSDLLD